MTGQSLKPKASVLCLHTASQQHHVNKSHDGSSRPPKFFWMDYLRWNRLHCCPLCPLSGQVRPLHLLIDRTWESTTKWTALNALRYLLLPWLEPSTSLNTGIHGLKPRDSLPVSHSNISSCSRGSQQKAWQKKNITCRNCKEGKRKREQERKRQRERESKTCFWSPILTFGHGLLL